MVSIEATYSESSVPELLRRQALASPHRPWLLSDDRSLTFAEVDALVDHRARALRLQGVGHGDVVAMMMGNSVEFLVQAIALGRIGAVFVPINLANRGASLSHVLNHCEAPRLLVSDECLGLLREVLDQLVHLKTVVFVDSAPADALGHGLEELVLADLLARTPTPELSYEQEQVRPQDLWSVMYTSGTTGPSKGAMMTHLYWCVASRAMTDNRDIRDDDVFYVCSPMFHAAAWLVQIIPSLMLGLPVAIDAGFTTRGFWDRVRKYGATQLLTMAATTMWLWSQPERPDDADNPVRVWAPVPFPAEHQEALKERFGVEHLWFTYGGTEFMCVTVSDVVDGLPPAGSSGRARAGVELMVVDDEDRPVAAGDVGELLVRPTVPSSIFSGYYRMAQATVDAWRNLWYHTGDLVKIEADGYVWFVDRKADYLRVRGENVSSFEVESVLAGHDAVAEVVAHSVVTAGSGEVQEDEIKVCVVLKEGHHATARELVDHASRDLPKHAVPRFVEVVEDFPRTPTGRVQKHRLRARGLTPTTWDREAPVHAYS